MKLTAPWVDQTQTQFDVQALPDDHPATEKLHEAFGVHRHWTTGRPLDRVARLGTRIPRSRPR
jgi:hypothetical protein